jgi:hypothetical protein
LFTLVVTAHVVSQFVGHGPNDLIGAQGAEGQIGISDYAHRLHVSYSGEGVLGATDEYHLVGLKLRACLGDCRVVDSGGAVACGPHFVHEVGLTGGPYTDVTGDPIAHVDAAAVHDRVREQDGEVDGALEGRFGAERRDHVVGVGDEQRGCVALRAVCVVQRLLVFSWAELLLSSQGVFRKPLSGQDAFRKPFQGSRGRVVTTRGQ